MQLNSASVLPVLFFSLLCPISPGYPALYEL
ncbi:Hypothetical Protein XCAW_01133 [Xanthomonas citri subsp. citri Aw12879]|nr:Hypothetical Protein XCAW_01133 [Xanthomonas citri subsp. citri Aw12879]